MSVKIFMIIHASCSWDSFFNTYSFDFRTIPPTIMEVENGSLQD